MRCGGVCARLVRVSEPGGEPANLVERLRRAIEQHDVEAFGALLAADARWGGDDQPNRCRSRADVVGTLVRGVAAGGSAEIEELVAGDRAVLCALRVRWPYRDGRAPGELDEPVAAVAAGGPAAPGEPGQPGEPGEPGRPSGRRLFHVYRVEDGLIAEILAFEDRRSAATAAGLTG